MSSSRWFLAAVSSLALVGCSLQMNESAPASSGFGMTGGSTGCLKGGSVVLQNYFDGKASSEEVRRLLDCADDSLRLFIERTQGKETGKYLPGELKEFLERYFLVDQRLSDSLVSEGMELKVALLGGSASELTAGELSRARELIVAVREELIKLQPYMPLTPEWARSPGMDEERIQRATEALLSSARVLGRQIERSQAPYLFDRLSALLLAIEPHYDGEGPRKLREQIPLLRAAKPLLLGAPEGTGEAATGIASDDWARMLSIGSQWYALLLRSSFLDARYPKWNSGRPYELAGELLNEAKRLLVLSAGNHPGGFIPSGEIHALIQALEESDWLERGDRVKRLTEQLLVLKAALFGGDAAAVTVTDTNRLFDLVHAVRFEWSQLEDYAPLTLENFKTFDASRTENLARLIEEGAQRIAEALPRTPNGYGVQQLGELLTALRPYTDESTIDTLLGRLPLLRAAKPVLLGAPDEVMTANDWRQLLEFSGRTAALGLRATEFLRGDLSWDRGAGRNRLMTIAGDARTLLLDVLSRQPERTLSFERLDALMDALDPADLLPMKAATLKQVARAALTRALGGTERGARARPIMGLNIGHVTRVWDALEQWSTGQVYLEGLFAELAAEDGAGPDFSGKGYTRTQLLSVSVPRAVRRLGRGLAPQGLQGIADLRNLFLLHQPFFEPSSPRIAFPALPLRNYSFRDLSELNWTHRLARILMQGYPATEARAISAEGLTYDEFKQFCDDVRQLGIEIKYIDGTRYDMHFKRFRESNLFLPSSDGDNLVSVTEARELLQYMVSAKRLSSSMHWDLARKCGAENAALDPFDYPYIPAACYREQFFKHRREYLTSMPALLETYDRLADEPRRKFEVALEEAGRLLGYSQSPVDSTDTEGISMVVHYIETIFARFDRDHSQTLNRDESMQAYSVFRRILAEYLAGLNMKSERQIEAVYTYLLAHGRPPADNWKGKADFLRWMATRGSWSFEADRTRIAQVFSTVGTMQPQK